MDLTEIIASLESANETPLDYFSMNAPSIDTGNEQFERHDRSNLFAGFDNPFSLNGPSLGTVTAALGPDLDLDVPPLPAVTLEEFETGSEYESGNNSDNSNDLSPQKTKSKYIPNGKYDIRTEEYDLDDLADRKRALRQLNKGKLSVIKTLDRLRKPHRSFNFALFGYAENGMIAFQHYSIPEWKNDEKFQDFQQHFHKTCQKIIQPRFASTSILKDGVPVAAENISDCAPSIDTELNLDRETPDKELDAIQLQPGNPQKAFDDLYQYFRAHVNAQIRRGLFSRWRSNSKFKVINEMQTGFLDLHQPAAKVEDVKNFMPIFSPEFGVSTATMWKNLGNLDKLDITKNKRSYLYLLKVLDKLTKLRHEPPLPKNNPFDDNRLPTLLQSQNSISPLITEVVEPENVANNTSSDVVNNYRASSLSPMLERPRLGDPPRSRINILTATHQELLSLLDPRPLSERELSTRASTDQNIRSQNNIVLPANEISSIPQTEQVSENNTQAKSSLFFIANLLGSNELSKSDEGSEGDDGEEFEVKN
ncbi:hypothetical protein HDV02_006283, partial [Globomyces sp. JEL0801]